jgi:hypothetical protein
MLRDDTSPVKVRIKSMSETMSRLAFSAVGILAKLWILLRSTGQCQLMITGRS